jgi:hypothetical protein
MSIPEKRYLSGGECGANYQAPMRFGYPEESHDMAGSSILKLDTEDAPSQFPMNWPFGCGSRNPILVANQAKRPANLGYVLNAAIAAAAVLKSD